MKLAAVKTKTIAIMSSAAFIRIDIYLLYHKNVKKSSIRKPIEMGQPQIHNLSLLFSCEDHEKSHVSLAYTGDAGSLAYGEGPYDF